jgi:hypothetical protein
MGIFDSIKNFFSRGKAPAAKAAGGTAVAGPDRASLDSLQSKADGSAQVKGLSKMAEAASPDSGGQSEIEMQSLAEPKLSDFKVQKEDNKIPDKGATSFHEQTVSAVAGVANAVAPGDTGGLADILTGSLQQAGQAMYSARDFYEKGDWKSGAAMVTDMINAFIVMESKLNTFGIPGLQDAVPFIGGAITGFRQMINVARVSESMDTLQVVMDKISLSPEDQAVLKAFTKEQRISQVKHATLSVLGFARLIGEFFGAGPIVGAVAGVVSGVSALRDQWINYRERTVAKAQDRLDMKDGVEGDDRTELEGLNDVLNQEAGVRITIALGDDMEEEITGDQFSIFKLAESYNALQANKRELERADKEDPSYVDLQTKVTQMERALQTSIDEYNTEMTRLTDKFFGNIFKPVTLDQVQKLHDYHLTCMHRLLQQGKERQEKIEASNGFVRFFSKTQDKQKILQQLYGGKVPKKVDLKMADQSADAQAYFWGKTREALDNALLPAQKSKATLVKEMRQIMLKNKGTILDSMEGSGGMFQTEDSFESDMNRVLNTLNL